MSNLSSRAKTVLRFAPLFALLCVMTVASAQTGGESDSVSRSLAREMLRMLQPGFEQLPLRRQNLLCGAFNAELRELAHGFLFFAIGLSAWLAMGARYPQDGPRRLIAGYLIAMAAAVLDETHQLFTDGRDFQLADLFVDWGGAGLGSMLALGFSQLLKRKKPVSG
ncbi:MAG: VanZ family protein [Eubacteriales bacterium]|nr:VanZ family protein [Eubacteriales bacterium]